MNTDEKATNILTQKGTGAALDAMMDMLPYVQEIVSDPEFTDYKKTINDKKSGVTLMDMSKDAFNLIASKHRRALYGIVAAVTGQSAEEIDAQPLRQTMEVFQGATGSEIINFFAYCAFLVARM